MEVTLRKAAKIRSAVETAIKAISISSTISVPFGIENALAFVKAAETKANEEIAKMVRLEEIAVGIRMQIGKKNEAQINGLMAQRARLCRVRDFYKKLLAGDAFNETEFTAKFNYQQSSSSSSARAYGADSMNTEVFSAESTAKMESEVAKYNNAINELDDTLNEANIKTMVTISDADIEYLRNLRVL